MSYKWSCPLCEPIDGQFERQTKFALDIATATHIISSHEDPAALRAVNSARLHCTETTCSLGKNRVYDSSASSFVPKLSEYDHKLLKGIKIKID